MKWYVVHTLTNSEKRAKKLVDFNNEIRELRDYLGRSKVLLTKFVGENLGAPKAIEAIKLAKEIQVLLDDFVVNKALLLSDDNSQQLTNYPY